MSSQLQEKEILGIAMDCCDEKTETREVTCHPGTSVEKSMNHDVEICSSDLDHGASWRYPRCRRRQSHVGMTREIFLLTLKTTNPSRTGRCLQGRLSCVGQGIDCARLRFSQIIQDLCISSTWG